MFYLSKKNNIELTKQEFVDLKKRCSKYVCVKDIKFVYNKALTGQYQACYKPHTKDTIYLSKGCSVPAIAHELKHREQRYRDGFVIYCLIMTFFRNYYEREAYAEEDRIDYLTRIV